MNNRGFFSRHTGDTEYSGVVATLQATADEYLQAPRKRPGDIDELNNGFYDFCSTDRVSQL